MGKRASACYNSARTGFELSDREIRERASIEPIVYRKKLRADNRWVIGFACYTTFKGRKYLRKMKTIVEIGHPYLKLRLGYKLKDMRIRRIETTEDIPWYNATNRMYRSKPIYYYYELSAERDFVFRGWRFRRAFDDKMRFEDYNFVCINALKLELAKSR